MTITSSGLVMIGGNTVLNGYGSENVTQFMYYAAGGGYCAINSSVANAPLYLSRTSSYPAGVVIQFGVNGSGVGSIDTDGTSITIKKVAGITFPATQNASSDANTLDDYEEGTWTPTIGGYSSVNYAYRQGSYTKIGRTVIAYWDLHVTSVTGSFNGTITGLPFNVSGSMAGYSVVHHRSSDLFNSNGVVYGQLKGYAEKGYSFLALQVDYSTTSSFGTDTYAACNGTGRSTGYVIYDT